jgi:hypothetical protein
MFITTGRKPLNRRASMTKTLDIVCNACAMGKGDCFCGKDWTIAELPHIPDCDYCQGDYTVKVAEYDAQTFGGFWAYMCKYHYLLNAKYAELGVGKGQRLVVTK